MRLHCALGRPVLSHDPRGGAINGYLKGSFLVPLAASVEAAGLKLTPEVTDAHMRRWLYEVAIVRVHVTTKAVPDVRWAEEQAVTIPVPASVRACRPYGMPAAERRSGAVRNAWGQPTVPVTEITRRVSRTCRAALASQQSWRRKHRKCLHFRCFRLRTAVACQVAGRMGGSMAGLASRQG